jgi:hypothetical protein
MALRPHKDMPDLPRTLELADQQARCAASAHPRAILRPSSSCIVLATLVLALSGDGLVDGARLLGAGRMVAETTDVPGVHAIFWHGSEEALEHLGHLG